MNKLITVHMLPSTTKTNVVTASHYHNRLRFVHDGYVCDPKDEQFQYHYFTSDEKITVGSWVLFTDKSIIYQVEFASQLDDFNNDIGCRKVVATNTITYNELFIF